MNAARAGPSALTRAKNAVKPPAVQAVPRPMTASRTRAVTWGAGSVAAATASSGTEALVGDEADPGVPWTYATTRAGDLALMLKSGNFGAPDLFTRALSTTGKE